MGISWYLGVIKKFEYHTIDIVGINDLANEAVYIYLISWIRYLINNKDNGTSECTAESKWR